MSGIDISAGTPATGPYRVDVSRGSRSGIVSTQWFNRPADERFLSLQELLDAVRARQDRSREATVVPSDIRVMTDHEDIYDLKFGIGDQSCTPTHWSFGQLCQTIGAPASYLRKLPAIVAERPLQYGLAMYRQGGLKAFMTDDRDSPAIDLRAVTSLTYGRIPDWEVVDAVQKVAGDDWKVPGTINWRTGEHDPTTPITKESTTLYGSDHDVFIFLCRDHFPIEVGKLPDGSPDMLFPGFVVSNSEVGSRSLQIEVMFIRGVCQNRNLWGVEGSERVRIIHTESAPERFLREAQPLLERFVNTATRPVIDRVKAAKATQLADNDDERMKVLMGAKFSVKAAKAIMSMAVEQDGRPARSAWDFCQAISAHARTIEHTDDRLEVERTAGRFMAA